MKKNRIMIIITMFMLAITASTVLGYRNFTRGKGTLTQESVSEELDNQVEVDGLEKGIGTEDIEKLNSMIEKEREKLKYDEAINIEFKGKKIVIIGVEPLEGMESVEKYYPNLAIPTDLGQYKFESALIYENPIGNYYVSDEKIVSQEELGRVYKRKLKQNNIKNITLKYNKSNRYIFLNIHKGHHEESRKKLNEKYDKHTVIDGGIEYSILSNKGDDDIKGAYFETNVNKEVYYINLKVFQDNNVEQVQEKEIIRFLKAINMVNFIKKLNINEANNVK